MVYAPHILSMVWSDDGKMIYASDGRTMRSFPIDMATGASPAEVRRRLSALTTARIVHGKLLTP